MQRRKFIELGALTAPGMLLSADMLGKTTIFSGADTLRFGIIGTGSRGKGLMSLFNKLPGAEIIACCDIIPFRLEEGLGVAGKKATGYSDYRKFLENKDIDCVIISTPFSEHGTMAVDALESGKHVYCEKTMAKGNEATRKLTNAVRASDKIFQVGYQYHSSRLYVHVADMIRNGELGEIAAIECQWNRNNNWRREVPDPKWERLINWRMYREYSGGLVAELCSHQMDFVNWILDDHPGKMMGTGSIDYWKDGRETYDNVHLICEYSKGVKATFTCLTTNSLGDYKIKVLGKDATITLDYSKAWIYPENVRYREKGNVDGVSGATVKWAEDKGYPIEVEHKDPTLQALLDFTNNIKNNTTPAANIEAGARASYMVQMSLDAMDNETIESWKDDYNL